MVCGWVIEHLPDPHNGLRELARVLRPGGKLLLLATEDTFTGAMCGRLWHCRTYNRAALRQACEECGLPWHPPGCGSRDSTGSSNSGVSLWKCAGNKSALHHQTEHRAKIARSCARVTGMERALVQELAAIETLIANFRR